MVDDVRNFLFGAPGQGGFDLVSLNIQRGRDHGLADYNTVRVACGLPKVTSFAQITSDTAVQASLQQASLQQASLQQAYGRGRHDVSVRGCPCPGSRRC